MTTAALSTKGQIVIPKAIREKLELCPGDVLDFVIQDDGSVVMRPAVEHVRSLKGLLYRPGRKPVTVEAMDQAIRRRIGTQR